MTKAIHYFFKLLEFLVVACMVAMVIMVFGNVVLRYCFIWLTYIGAMVAMRDGAHLGVDTLIRKLSLNGKKVCFVISQLLMLFCNVLFLMGTYQMHNLQVTNVSPVVGLSMIWVYGIGYVVSIVMGIFNVEKLWRLFAGRMSEDELVQVMESEDQVPEAGAARTAS